MFWHVTVCCGWIDGVLLSILLSAGLASSDAEAVTYSVNIYFCGSTGYILCTTRPQKH